MVPANTTLAIIQATHRKLYQSISQRTEVAAQYAGTELSVSSLFNGIIKDRRLPDQSAWQAAYASNTECRQILRMIESKIINNDTLSQVHPTYRSPMRKSQIRWEQNRLTIHEPIFNSTQTVRLIIVPKDLQHHIFTAFHTNPLGGHFSVYYTLHRIRLRFHWPGMYTQIKRWIQCGAACVLRNSGSKVSSELL
jgi:hypothetical protein